MKHQNNREESLSEDKWLEYESPIRTYRSLIEEEMWYQGESFKDLVKSTYSDEMLEKEIDTSLGCYQIEAFALWTRQRVYFPTTYDGGSDVASVSRNPDYTPIEPIS